MRNILVVPLVIFLAACPADGPLEPPDSGRADMGSQDGTTARTLALTAVTPAQGPVAGGTEVTLTGEGFEEGMTVRFGNASATDAIIVSQTEATATTLPSSAAGAVTVVIELDGEITSLSNGFTFTGTAQPGGSVNFCQLQAQSPVSATRGAPSPALYALVFAEGVTPGGGQGAGIEGELGYGTDANVEGFEFTTMTYNVDLDGLTPGDQSNDEYGAPLTIDQAGSYNYVARFRRDGGEWTYCDLDGSENGTSTDQLGIIDVADTGGLADACRLQFPQIVENATVGQGIDFFGRVTAAGITGSQTANDNLIAQLFTGPVGSDPRSDFNSFAAVDATLSAAPLNLGSDEDEYTATFAPTAQGELAFGFRFSTDAGATWRYCGLQDGNGSGNFAVDSLGHLTAGGGDTIDFCHIWQDTMTDDAAAETQPLVTVEVFEDPLTVGNGGANSAQLEVEAAVFGLEQNPALATSTWNPLPFKGPRSDAPNNYEFEGTPYTDATHPGAGSYHVIARVRSVGQPTWTYCDVDESAADFRIDAASKLTVSP